MHNSFCTFWLDGVCSDDLGVVVQSPPVFGGAEPKVTTYSIPGRNGDVNVWDGTYTNVTGEIECYLLDPDNVEPLISAVNALLSDGAYHKLILSTEPGRYRMARLVNSAEINIRVMRLAPFTLTFDCKPQRFFDSNDMLALPGTGGIVYNPTAFASRPLIRAYTNPDAAIRNATITITNGDHKSELSLGALTESGYIEIDYDSKSAIWRDGEVQHIYTAFPAEGFWGGQNSLVVSTNLTTIPFSKLEIYPRWWTL